MQPIATLYDVITTGSTVNEAQRYTYLSNSLILLLLPPKGEGLTGVGMGINLTGINCRSGALAALPALSSSAPRLSRRGRRSYKSCLEPTVLMGFATLYSSYL